MLSRNSFKRAEAAKCKSPPVRVMLAVDAFRGVALSHTHANESHAKAAKTAKRREETAIPFQFHSSRSVRQPAPIKKHSFACLAPFACGTAFSV